MLLFGIIAFAIYYIYEKDNRNNEHNDLTVVTETKSNEITNIRFGVSNLDNLNPIISKNQNIQDISRLIYEPLLKIKENFELEGVLAEEWSKAEDKVYLIKLREGIKWHNGSNLIAGDVKFTVDTIKSLGNEYVYFANVSNIEKVDIISDTILRIYLYEEEPLFEYNLTFPIISMTFFSGEDIKISEECLK